MERGTAAESTRVVRADQSVMTPKETEQYLQEVSYYCVCIILLYSDKAKGEIFAPQFTSFHDVYTQFTPPVTSLLLIL